MILVVVVQARRCISRSKCDERESLRHSDVVAEAERRGSRSNTFCGRGTFRHTRITAILLLHLIPMQITKPYAFYFIIQIS